MDWATTLSDLILGGVANMLGAALPRHWRDRARERLSDFNPFKVIAGNHDLLWAVRLAWVKAALDILDAAKDAAERAPHEFNSPRLLDFEQLAREALRGIRCCRWRTVEPRAPPIYLSDCFSKDVGAPEPFRIPLVNVRC